MRLSGKLITAAASGMGCAGCELFVREGATVFATDVDARGLDEVVGAIVDAGGRAYSSVADLLDPSACNRVMDEAARLMGGVDIVWNQVSRASAISTACPWMTMSDA